MDNKKLGNAFEAVFSSVLADSGFWVHRLTQNSAGQPADVIAVKDTHAYLIDCKVCTGNRFKLSRAEENQLLAMQKWYQCGNGRGWFAIHIEGQTYMLSHEAYQKAVCSGKQTLSAKNLDELAYPLKTWIKLTQRG